MTDLPINKTMDRGDLESPAARVVVEELNALIRTLRKRDLKVSAWVGFFKLSPYIREFERINRGYGYGPLDGAADDANFPWFLYWEIATVVLNNDFRPGDRLLDMGGSSSLFSYYIASKGLEVTTVDLRPGLVTNANRVAQEMGWNLKNHVMDMRELEFDYDFDHVTSICVFEHIPLGGRIEINQRMRQLLKPRGSFSITFDYRNPSRAAGINSPDDVQRQFVEPSGLEIRGNAVFYDSRINYLLHPFYYSPRWWRGKWRHIRAGEFPWYEFLRVKRENDYTFGALFLQKSGSNA